MTPAQHKNQAETFLAQYQADPTRVSISSVDLAEVHAYLANATGEGSHYASAEQLLEDAAGSFTLNKVRAAKFHAILADR